MEDMLPQPSDPFAWVQAAAGPALVCRALEPLASHFFTTRAWALGSAPPEETAGWDEVAHAAGVSSPALVRLRQVHGATVFFPGSSDNACADIVVDRGRGRALAIQTADCVPLLLADRRTGAVAAVHAGWRGIAARAPQAAVRALAEQFGSRAADLVAAIGPSIGACCYEVGADVRQAMTRAGFDDRAIQSWFSDEMRVCARNPPMAGLPASVRPQHWFFDPCAATRFQLEEAGVGSIHAAELCTASHPAFCSYRRDGKAAGRMAAVIAAREADIVATI